MAGPGCGYLLAAHGAEVVKVEPPAGDWLRGLGPRHGDHSAMSLAVNRGKRGVALDLKHPRGRAAALRGRPRFAYFAPTKAAQRVLAESMARDLGPKGVHVAYILVDAAIDTPRTRPVVAADKPDEFFCKPSAIADEAFHIAHQDRSAWSLNVELRSDIENW